MGCGLDEKTQRAINIGEALSLIDVMEGQWRSEEEPCCFRGFVLGSDTEETWGTVCPNGCRVDPPLTKEEKNEMQAAHDRARRKIGL